MTLILISVTFIGADWDQKYTPTLGEHVFSVVSGMNLESQVDPVSKVVPDVSVDLMMLPTKQILVLIRTDTDDTPSMMAAGRIESRYRKKIGQLVRAYWSKVGVVEADFSYKITGKDFGSMLGK